MVDLASLAFAGGFAVVGVLVAYVGYDRVRVTRALAAHETVPPGAVTPGEVVKVKGRAEPVDGTHVAPVDGSEAVATEYEIEQQDLDNEGTNWQTLKREKTVEPFRVEGDGSVLVADDSPTIEVTSDSRAEERIDRSELEGKRNLPIALSELSVSDTGGYRHSQKSIRPGQEVVVFGTAREHGRSDGGDGSVAIGRGDRTDRFYLLDSEDALSSPTLYALVALFGLVLVVVGVGVGLNELLALAVRYGLL